MLTPVTARPAVPAPGPYTWEAVANGMPNHFHCYVLDANGRRIAAVWGKAGEQGHTAALLAASAAMRDALKSVLLGGDEQKLARLIGEDVVREVRAALARATEAPALTDPAALDPAAGEGEI